ncbi:Ig-like domain-containing protein [Gemmatimonas sp.]|uniref:Ig-like domain-containing protein n=1 Tax=Gemmatimonas sp. TaxID=1962908 RepID=UPI003342057C
MGLAASDCHRQQTVKRRTATMTAVGREIRNSIQRPTPPSTVPIMSTDRLRSLGVRAAACAALLLAGASCSAGDSGGGPTPPAPVTTLSVTVAPATLTLTGAGATGTLTATVTTSVGVASTPTVAWTSSNTAVATVSGSGATATVTTVAPGSATITATSGGQSGSTSVTVNPPITTQSVVIAPTTLTLVGVGTTGQLTATVNTSAGVAANPVVTWTSSNPAVATVAGTSASATVTTVAPGSTTISASSGGQSGSATITVAPPAQTLTVTVSGDGTGSVTSSPAGISCTTGSCTGSFAAGTSVTLTATASAGSTLDAWGGSCAGTGSCTVVMSQARTVAAGFRRLPVGVATVTITPSVINVDEGATSQLTAVLRDSAGNSLTGRTLMWSVSDTASATVSATGLVTGKSEGDTVLVTALSDGIRGTAKLKVRSLFFLATDVSAGGEMTCAIRVSDGAWCWGSTSSGALGDPAPRVGAFARPIGGQTYTQIAAAGNFVCARNAASAAFCWGYNGEGQLGDSSRSGTFSTRPVQVAGGRAFSSLVPLGFGMCGLTASAIAYCWGFNGFSGFDLLGVSSSAHAVSVPRLVAGGYQWRQLSGGGFLCGISTGSQALCWGGGGGGVHSSGRIGDGSNGSRTVPTALAGNPSFRSISAGDAMGCALDANGDLWCWGGNNRGQLATGDFVNTRVPVRSRSSARFVGIVTASNHGCGLTSAGEAWCWGDGRAGQLGNGESVGSNVPVRVAQGSIVFTKLSALGSHTCGIATNRRVYCWGENGGKLGFLGSNSNVPLPVQRPEP